MYGDGEGIRIDEDYFLIDDSESWIEAIKKLLIAEGAKLLPAKVYLVKREFVPWRRRS